MKVKRVVITGGPCAGKSTVLEAVRVEFASRALIVPEVATMLLGAGFPAPGDDLTWSLDWQMNFENAILPVQKNLEAAYELMAKEMGVGLLVCDRGLLDGAAYTPGGQAAFCEIYKLCLAESLLCYEAVIHLESLAVGKPELYGKTNNSNRFEGLERAVQLEYATREAWQGHPSWQFLSCEDGIEGKIHGTFEMIRKL